MKAIKLRQSLAQHWNSSDNSAAMLLLLLSTPELVDPLQFDRYTDWLRQELMTTNHYLKESRFVDFENKQIWSDDSVENDLLDKRIDQAEAERRRRMGALQTARLCSDFVATAKNVDTELDKVWGRRTLNDSSGCLVESTCRSQQAVKLREIVGNPFT